MLLQEALLHACCCGCFIVMGVHYVRRKGKEEEKGEEEEKKLSLVPTSKVNIDVRVMISS